MTLEFGPHYGGYIGATDEAVEGQWRWLTSGEPVTFEILYTGEPNNVDGDENCLSMSITYGWHDVPCNSVLLIDWAVCEFDYVPGAPSSTVN